MASTSTNDDSTKDRALIESAKILLWGNDVKYEVFRRWTQGFVFSEDEPTALAQLEGGPCAILAPVQGFLLKNVMFSQNQTDNWRTVSKEQRSRYLEDALEDILHQCKPEPPYYLVNYTGDLDKEPAEDSINCEVEEGESSPKKRRRGHEDFHEGTRCEHISSKEELHSKMHDYISAFTSHYGVLLYLYSIILTKGIDQIKNEIEDPNESLIDGTYGHGSQSLINLLLTGKAVSNVWDNDKEVTGLKLRGICRQAPVGFLTLLEHLRYCEVGWYLKNPNFPIWLIGSETHLTVLFSFEKSLVGHETPEAAARRVFNSYDTEGSNFVSSNYLGEILGKLDLVSEPEYVKIMVEKMDPEQLGIITLNSFMDEFFPCNQSMNGEQTFVIYHYNGLQRSCPNNKVAYQEGSAVILEMPDIQIITDTSAIKTCLMTKWPTIELEWKNRTIPSIN